VQKITRKTDFDDIMGQAAVASTAHFVLHSKQVNTVNRIGAVVPKRLAKKAVTRNAIKRQIYACASQQAWANAPADRVVRLRRAWDPQRFHSASSAALKQAVRNELIQLFERENPAPCAAS